MNTHDDSPTDPRPLGFWLRAVDALLHRAFAEALEAEGVSRRDWMLLNVVDGTVDTPWLAERLARRSGRVRRLAERGWITEAGDGWQLTDDGRAAKERLGGIVDGIRARVAGAVSPEDFATTMASLQAIARELGWDENAPDESARHGRPHPHGADRRLGGFPESASDHGHGFGRHGRGFGPGFRPGSGLGFGLGFGGHGRRFAGFGAGSDAHEQAFAGDPCHGGRPGSGRHGRHSGERADGAFERGFAAGFAQGRAAASDPAA
jgi:hypothetical protein